MNHDSNGLETLALGLVRLLGSVLFRRLPSGKRDFLLSLFMVVAAVGIAAMWSPPRDCNDDPLIEEVAHARRDEEPLELDRSRWQRVQRGLARAGFSPGGADGIPGDSTRAAIGRWQISRCLPPTGYLDASQVAELETSPPDPPEPPVAPLPVLPVEPPASLLAEAEGGSAGAQTELGLLYAAGKEIRQNYGEAVRWFERAGNNDHGPAVAHLAVMHLAGEGVRRSPDRAIEVLEEHPQLGPAGAAISGASARIGLRYGELETDLASSYGTLTRDYLRWMTPVDWHTDNPSVRVPASSTRRDFSDRNRRARERLRQVSADLRTELIRDGWSAPTSLLTDLAAAAWAQRERRPNLYRSDAATVLVDRLGGLFDEELRPAIDAGHRGFQEEVDTHYDRFGLMLQSPEVCALLIDVDPGDAVVYVNDIRYGTANEFETAPGRLLPADTVTIRLERPGYQSYVESIPGKVLGRYTIRGNMLRDGLSERNPRSEPNNWRSR